MEDKITQTETEGKGAENELTLDKDTYSKDEMMKLLQAESDRRVSSALKKAEKAEASSNRRSFALNQNERRRKAPAAMNLSSAKRN